MRVLTLKNAEIVEIVLRPNEGLPVVISYRLKDDQGNIVFNKTAQIKLADLPPAAQNSLTSLSAKLLTKLELDEGL